MPGTIDWMYHRKGWTSCVKSREFLEQNGWTVGEIIDATKIRKGRDAALELARTANTVVVARGKKVVTFDMAAPPDDDTLAGAMLGPTGNLKAPTLRVGGTLLVGFGEAGYAEVLKWRPEVVQKVLGPLDPNEWMALRGEKGLLVYEQTLSDRIVTDPRIMVGKPVVKGTRLTVEFILNLLAHDPTGQEILDEYNGLTREDIQACLSYDIRWNMPKPEEVLSPGDYTNYRNVRAVSVLFVLLGGVLVLGGIMISVKENPNPNEQIPPAAGIGIALAGLAGAIGGVAALRGNRRWSPLVYVMAALYVLACPIGTILSFVMLTGLSRYLDSVERVEGASRR